MEDIENEMMSVSPICDRVGERIVTSGLRVGELDAMTSAANPRAVVIDESTELKPLSVSQIAQVRGMSRSAAVVAGALAAVTGFGSRMSIGARESIVLSLALKRSARHAPNPPRQHFYRGHSTNGVTLYNLSAWEIRYLRGIDARHNPSGNKLWRKARKGQIAIIHWR